MDGCRSVWCGATLLALLASAGCANRAASTAEVRSERVARPTAFQVPDCAAPTAVVSNNSDAPIYLYRRVAGVSNDPVSTGQYIARADPGTTRVPVGLPPGTLLATTRPQRVPANDATRRRNPYNSRWVDVRWECRADASRRG